MLIVLNDEGKETGRVPVDSAAASLAVHPSQPYVAVGTEEGGIVILEQAIL